MTDTVAEASNAHPSASQTVEPASKKQKTAANTASASSSKVVRPSLFLEESRSQLRQELQSAQPYTHVFIQDLCDPCVLRDVREEVIHNISATYKETDLFKVFQTGDLANMDALDPESAAKLPNLMALRDAIYSQQFRSLVEDITGVTDLSTKTDMSCNVYAQGGHLLNHDDVIGTRAVSFIIYLTDPDEPWAQEDGGALELYPLVEGTPHTPDVIPRVSHLPAWNCMAMFVVQPGKSFHSVQEVVSATKPRFSISGWYHRDRPQEGAAHASLQQLQMKAGQDQIQAHTDFQGDTAADFSDSDLQQLGQWLNPAYLKPENWPRIADAMEADGSVQLKQFLKADIADAITAAAKAQDAAEGVGGGKIPPFTAGYAPDWRAVGPPHKQRYMQFCGQPAADAPGARGQQGPAADGTTHGAAAHGSADAGTAAVTEPAVPVGSLMAAVQQGLFETAAFARLLRAMLDVQLLQHAGRVRRFRAGLDYTVAHYGIITSSPRLDAVLTFVDDCTPAAADDWSVGESGGFEAYLLADEEEEQAGAAAVYRQDGNDSAVINIPAVSNCLSLVMRDAGLMHFVKYVSAAAPGSRWDIAMEYVPEDDGVDPPMPPSPVHSSEQQDQQQQQPDVEGEGQQL